MKMITLQFPWVLIVFALILFGCGTPCPVDNKVENLSPSRIRELTQKIKNLSPEGKNSLLSKLLQVNPRNYNFVPQQLLVKFKESTTQSKIDSILSTVNSLKLYQFRTNQTLLIHIPSALTREDLFAIAAAMMEVESVEYVHPNSILRLVATPNDPSFGEQEDLNNTGLNGLMADADIDAPEAWDITTGSSSITVGIIDTGIDYTHPDLAANIWNNPGESGLDGQGNDKSSNGIDDDGNGYVDDFRGWDFKNNDNDPMDDHMHGTHVAGTIGAVGNNGVGISGINWDVRMVPLKFLGSDGSGTLADAIKALEYANLMNISITNNSWGGGGYEPALEAAIRAAGNKGFLFVAAAGNDSSNNDSIPSYPASYNLPNVMSVAAVDSADVLAGFSNFGAFSVHVAAPGGNILSTLPGNQYGRLSGTSMATPHVTGLAALIKSKFPALNAVELKARIMGASDRVPSLTGKVISGRINAANSMEEDSILPNPVNNLTISFSGITRLRLQWPASGDDGSSGSASSYQIKISSDPIDSESKWENAKAAKFQLLSQSSIIDGQIVDLPLRSQGFVSVRALDNVGNMSPLGTSIPYKMTNPTLLFTSDGENFNGITSEPENSWGQEDVSGRGKVFSDSPGNSYENNVESALLVPPITVNYPDIVLTLSTKISCESGFDWAYIEYVTNNNTIWKNLATYSAENCDWANLSLQLGDKVNVNDTLRIRFRFSSNQSGQSDGWLIDDIRLLGISPPEAPSNFVGQSFLRDNGRLAWKDNSTSETYFEIKSIGSVVLPADSTSFDWLAYTVPTNLKIRACNGPLCSPFTSIQVLAPPPEIDKVNGLDADRFATSGGESVTLTGIGFNNQSKVLFGINPCLNYNFISSKKVKCISPGNAVGQYLIRAKNSGTGLSAQGKGAQYVQPVWLSTNGGQCNSVCGANGRIAFPEPVNGNFCASGIIRPVGAGINYRYGICGPEGAFKKATSRGSSCQGERIPPQGRWRIPTCEWEPAKQKTVACYCK